jgi:hypothetical protein
MGTVLTDLIGKMQDMQVVAGIDIASVDRPYPVFAPSNHALSRLMC